MNRIITVFSVAGGTCGILALFSLGDVKNNFTSVDTSKLEAIIIAQDKRITALQRKMGHMAPATYHEKTQDKSTTPNTKPEQNIATPFDEEAQEAIKELIERDKERKEDYAARREHLKSEMARRTRERAERDRDRGRRGEQFQMVKDQMKAHVALNDFQQQTIDEEKDTLTAAIENLKEEFQAGQTPIVEVLKEINTLKSQYNTRLEGILEPQQVQRYKELKDLKDELRLLFDSDDLKDQIFIPSSN